MVDAAKAYCDLLDKGGKMFLAMAGAMSTAEIGLSLAEMIRQDKFSFVCCSANNLEEDIMNLVAHSHYYRIPGYRDLTPEQEQELLENHYNRVTDTCIPEEEAFRRLEGALVDVWTKAKNEGKRYFPYEYIYDLVKTGVEVMMFLVDWYKANATGAGVGFFQIGGGTAGDFPICVVPMMEQDLGWKGTPLWSYFCQISDSTTSYGSYSGAVPNEKITWGKLSPTTPRFIVESDATIVAPLIFAYVLGW